MPLYRTSLQTLGAIALLLMALACHGKKGNSNASATPTVVISGTVTYTRIPLAKDANGVPTGLADATVATNLQTLPARGVNVRVYQSIDETNLDGTITSVWLLAGSMNTDSTLGTYSFTVAQGRPTLVEVLSIFNGGSQSIHLVGDPAGIHSTALANARSRYALLKGLDGSTPDGAHVPPASTATNATVNFAVGLNDTWWLVDPFLSPASTSTTFVTTTASAMTPPLETSLPGRTVGLGSGSSILAIGDTIASFVAVYGQASTSTPLLLHYWMGRSEPEGSYVTYDPAVFSNFNPFRQYTFASLNGGPVNDDAWDEGVIMPLLARNVLYSNNNGRTFSIGSNPIYPVSAALPDLSPDMARIEGLANAMASNVLKSPYLADTQGTALAAPVQDIRNLSMLTPGQFTPYSAPALNALAWEVILKANSLPSPGATTDWANINPLTAARFFIAPALTYSDGTRDAEPLNIFNQIARLKEAKAAAEPVDLAAIFTDAAITPLASPFGIAWPRPTTGAYALFVADWGTDPNSLITPITPIVLSMSTAVQAPVLGAIPPTVGYPNLSEGEVFYAGFKLSADKRYVLSATISPALPSTPGVQVEVDLPTLGQTFTFTGAGGSLTPMTIPSASTTPPVYHPVRVRLKSPAAVQPDTTVTLAFTPSL